MHTLKRVAARLNAPYGARCFLTKKNWLSDFILSSLNAPYGARCFLTAQDDNEEIDEIDGLNAPYGARCFLTHMLRIIYPQMISS